MRRITLAVLIVFVLSIIINYKLIALTITALSSATISLTVPVNVKE